MTALPFDPHPDSRSYVHVGDFDQDDRICKQELHPDTIHLPHPLPQSDPYYHPNHDSPTHFPIPGILPPYNTYISTHPSDHFGLQSYQNTDPTSSALIPLVSHEYPNDIYPIKENIFHYETRGRWQNQEKEAGNKGEKEKQKKKKQVFLAEKAKRKKRDRRETRNGCAIAFAGYWHKRGVESEGRREN